MVFCHFVQLYKHLLTLLNIFISYFLQFCLLGLNIFPTRQHWYYFAIIAQLNHFPKSLRKCHIILFHLPWHLYHLFLFVVFWWIDLFYSLLELTMSFAYFIFELFYFYIPYFRLSFGFFYFILQILRFLRNLFQ